MAQASNTNPVRSVAASGDAIGEDCTHVSLWDSQTSGTFLWRTAIQGNPSPLTAGEGYEFAAGALIIRQDVGTGETEAMAQRAAAGRVKDGVWVQYHNGDPGADGTANVIPDLTRTNIAESDFSII